ncbi:MAG: proB [Frankiales bacterium]|nr:proB [Frankiales bacterium]
MSDDGSRRMAIAVASRTVVKVGSSSITQRGRLHGDRLDHLVEALAARRAGGQQVVLVSSGAIAAGIGPLGLKSRPRDLATQQAAASVGQLLLAERYAASFARFGLTVGQVLLTAGDLHRRGDYRNAVRTLDRLLALGVIPIVNENDTVATHEIRFGDNDRLAALVAHAVQADALVLLSDVDGVYTEDPRLDGARLISEVSGPDDLARIRVGGARSGVGTGGMATKLDAASIASGAGIPVLLIDAPSVGAGLRGEGGTFFAAAGRRTTSRLFWLRHATAPRGQLTLDAGAITAVTVKRMSLLAAGVTSTAGDFAIGDPVEIVDEAGVVRARGLVGFDSEDLAAVLGRSSHELPPDLRREVVHRDDLVVL